MLRALCYLLYMKRDTARNSRGQAMVEFVLLLPMLLAVASLVIDMGNMIFVAHRLAAATREGSRVATETSVPAPENPGAGDSCELGTCGDGVTSICCIGINRANLVLFNSGINQTEIDGEWISDVRDGRRYVLYRVTAATTVDFFFGLGNQRLSSQATAYGDDFPVS